MAQSKVCERAREVSFGASDSREAPTHSLITLTRRDDEDIDSREIGVSSQAHLGLSTRSAVGEGGPDRGGGCSEGGET